MGSRFLSATRGLILRALARVSLLEPTYRLYQAVQAAKVELGERRLEADGLPVPPARLRNVVAGSPDAAWFLESGRLQAQMIRDAVGRHGRPVEGVRSMLDFGCGCGRVTRHWAGLDEAEIYGSDYNSKLVRWCASNLPFATFSVNELSPPAAYESARFDVIYAISVVTHLTRTLERAWIAELARLLRPGGLLLLTTHGDSYAHRLSPEERARYLAGDAVVRWGRVAGTNLCTAFHPEAYVRARLAPELELLEFEREGGAVGRPPHDRVVFRKPAQARPA